MVLTAGEEEKNLRIDRFIRKIIRTIPLSEIYQMIKGGDILVNGRRVKPDYRIKEGDIIFIPFEEEIEEETDIPDEIVDSLDIIYEDNSIICVNKPSGFPVHRGSKWSYGILDILEKKLNTHIYPVHRLDRDTSGVLLFAKKRSIAIYMTELFRTHRIEKIYLALVKGQIKGRGTIKAPLSRKKSRVLVENDGKPAVTEYYPIKSFSCCTLVGIKLYTGRTHQIRVHMSHIKHPLAGDWRYGEREFNIQVKKIGLKRLFLHAESIKFPHPGGNKTIIVKAPLPDDLQRILEKIN